MRGAGDTYRYERELEEFLRYSPSVRANAARADAPDTAAGAAQGRPAAAGATPVYDDLRAEEVIALLPSLDADALRALHAHETAHRGRRTVIRAIERLQRWEGEP
jgi:UDP-glucose 4-epimerase